MATNTITTSVQKLQPRKAVLPGLDTPGLLAKWPIIGLIMFIFGGLVFGALTYNLFAQGPLVQWDRALANTLPAIALKSPTFVKYTMITAFYVGERVIIVIDILLSLYFLYKRYWRELAMVTIGGVGAALLFHSFSTFIGRQRPPTQIWNIVHIPGFPSGHAISIVACYGLLAYLLVPKMPSVFWKVVVVSAALFIIGFVGFSRVFTGGHYLTDVLSGYAVGIAWFGMVYTLIEIYFQKRRSQNVKKG
jgi:membrane-associated phospholipid phosphatase